MKKFKNKLILGTISAITLLSSVTNVSANTIYDGIYESNLNEQEKLIELMNKSSDEFLLNIGMNQEEIDRIDSDIREFIVKDLKQNIKSTDLEFIETKKVLLNEIESREVLTGIDFYVSSFKSGDIIYIYPTYEFTTPKRPRGADGFAVQLGEAMRGYEYGGKYWYKVNEGDSWISESNNYMIANTNLYGAEYKGRQLGTPDFNIYIKGCAYIHATAGESSDKRINLAYVHNPDKNNFSFSISAGGIGISYTPSSNIYDKTALFTLDY